MSEYNEDGYWFMRFDEISDRYSNQQRDSNNSHSKKHHWSSSNFVNKEPTQEGD